MKHIVLYSGGLGSYFTAKRMIENGIPKEDIILLFTDTKTEDQDLYRFLKESTEKLGIPLTENSDGRTIWEVFRDEKFIANTRVDVCSEVLKRNKSKQFIKKYDPSEIIIYFGYDWTEIDRFTRTEKRWKPYTVKAPLCDPPYIDKGDMKRILVEEDGIELPRLYKFGFQHNNCGGGCVKAGIGHFAMLLDKFPERYAEWEKNEKEIIEHIGKNVSILTRGSKKNMRTITLEDLRKEIQSLSNSELCDIGGCGCFEN